MKREIVLGYTWSAAGILAATAVLWLARGSLNTGQASLLYLPVVIACAIRFGFGAAVLGAVLGFGCWDFFFLPPRYTLAVTDPGDWISLAVFLGAALTTAHLASRLRYEAAGSREREAEIATLFQASETVSGELAADNVIAALARQLRALCRSDRCIVWRVAEPGRRLLVLHGDGNGNSSDAVEQSEQAFAEAAAEHGQTIGLELSSSALWSKAVGADAGPAGVYLPLRAQDAIVGVLLVGRKADGSNFCRAEMRLIQTLANHAALAIARDTLAAEAAQAGALREADSLKDVLLSTVSHELRSPLAAIKATVGSLEQRLRGSDLDDLSAIELETDRLSDLVGNLLDLSRLEAGAWNPEYDWCDIGEIFGTALDRVGKSAADRVRLSLAVDAPMIRGDYAQLAIVLTNLLRNAAKYSPSDRSIMADVSATHDGHNEAATGVTIRIRDYGSGIAAGEETAIFGKFVRGEAQRRTFPHGSGLGLALCQAIVTAHRGRIWATNAPSGEPPGAIFWVFLPVD